MRMQRRMQKANWCFFSQSSHEKAKTAGCQNDPQTYRLGGLVEGVCEVGEAWLALGTSIGAVSDGRSDEGVDLAEFSVNGGDVTLQKPRTKKNIAVAVAVAVHK